MLLLVTTSYPVTAQQKTMEIFLQLMKNPLPDYVTTTGPYASWGGEGIESYTIFDIEEGKADDGLWEILTRLMNYYSVDGMKIKGTVLASIEEFMKRMGIEAPSA